MTQFALHQRTGRLLAGHSAGNHAAHNKRMARSPREREVLSWAAHGKTYAEISSLLGISEDTAKAHIEGANVKLGTRNKTHTVAIAVSLGLVNLTPKESH